MWTVRLALARPYTFIVFSQVLLLISPVVLLRTPVDIFPGINVPVISVIWTYTGLVPAEMETRIVSIVERSLTASVNNIEHIESQSLNGVGGVKVFLQLTADINGAISEVIAEAQAGLKQFPPATTPPLVLSYDASSVPILQLGLSGKGMSEQQLNDLGVNFIRPQLASIQGASVPIPYGGKVRQVMVDIDSHQLMAKGLSPLDVVNAVNAQNVILPTGTAKIGRTEYNVGMNGTPSVVDALNHIPVKVVNGGTLYIQDVAHVRDGYAVQQNIVRQDGQRGVMLAVQKSGNASTISIVSAIYKALPKIKATLPSQLGITPMRSIAVCACLAPGSGSRSRYRRRPDVADDSHDSGQLAQHLDYRHFHPAVKELLGHSNISTTTQYAHWNDEAKRRAVQRLKSGDKTVAILPRRAKIAV